MGRRKLHFVQNMVLLMAIISFMIVQTGMAAVRASGLDNGVIQKDKKEQAENTDLSLACESAVLMEPVSGEILFEKDKDKQLRPASVTKVMTLLLIMEAIDSQKISYQDKVSVSAHAASMGGSQVFLEEGETQTVEDMLKCIAVSSANDACVAMAEYVGGSEEAFVKSMNAKAKKLGMKNTHFVNSCGLDADGHMTTAYDIALMSRELTVKHPDIFKFTTIWMDTITHVTAKGSKEFGLSNTNKLIKQYNGATGLKTGSTSLAKFCLSATATRNDLSLIAVVMASPDSKERVKDASKLLDYGFANCSMYQDNKVLKNKLMLTVEQGKKEKLSAKAEGNFQYVLTKGQDSGKITKKLAYKKVIKAPVKKGDKVGTVTYYLDNQKIGCVPIQATETVKAWNMADCIRKVWLRYLIANK